MIPDETMIPVFVSSVLIMIMLMLALYVILNRSTTAVSKKLRNRPCHLLVMISILSAKIVKKYTMHNCATPSLISNQKRAV
jgi:hypothetical protein